MYPLGSVSGSTVLAVAGLVIGVLGFIAGVAGVAYARRRANLVFYQGGWLIVASRPEELRLEVRWDGRTVPAVSQSRILMWNAGSATLDRSKTIAGYPLRFSWGDESTEILDVDVLARSKQENLVSIDRDDARSNAVTVGFEYLDARDGVVFDVVHTSRASEATASGTLQGMAKPLQQPLRGEDLPSRFGYVWPFGGAILCLVLAVVFLVFALSLGRDQPTIAYWNGWGGFAFWTFLAVLFSWVEWDVWRKAPPWGLRKQAKAELEARSTARSANAK
jgi:hypothetical protein